MDILGFVRNLLPAGTPPASDLEPAPVEAARALEAFLEASASGVGVYSRIPALGDLPAGQAILEMEPEQQLGVVHAALERALVVKVPRSGEAQHWGFRAQRTTLQVLDRLLARKLPVDWAALSLILERTARITEAFRAPNPRLLFPVDFPMARLITLVERIASESGLPEGATEQLGRIRPAPEARQDDAEIRKLVARIDALRGNHGSLLPEPGEPWADALRQDLSTAPPVERAAWEALLSHARTADSSKPSAKWLKEAASRVESLGTELFVQRMQHWLPLVVERRTDHRERESEWVPDPDLILADGNADLLKGLAWCCAPVDASPLPHLLGDLAETCYRKVTWHGPRCPKVGNGAVHALSLSPRTEAAAQLSRLKSRVENPSALKQIEKALEAAAVRAGLTPTDLEEMAVPTFGLEISGSYRSQIGECVAEVRLDGTRDVRLTWFTQEGKPQKAVPAEVKRGHAEELKALQQTLKEIQKLLPAQRDRVERLLITEREWTLADWRERYLEHPLLAPLTRRLIWHFREGERTALAIPHGGTPVDVQGQPLGWLQESTRVRLWHPVGFDPETVLQWRTWLEENAVTQPFKQAHREIYLLTDAELATHIYSNRFAAHVLKQHQFKALCDQRGWTYRIQGGFDSGEVPIAVRVVPEWDLRAEFWVDPIGDGVNGMSETGICLYVSTDQVRFMRGETVVPLTDVPALAFTEVMRDVDLFVGVASVGNDPAWMDRGTQQFQDYWHSYSFGDLSNSAETRKQLLQRLLPRLKIRDRCSVDGKFLRVKGTLRTYKIHLGSSNILMEPNDQYLCIVPDRGEKAREEVFLPFEGDRTLSVILSKAFMLAEDTRIKDPSITRQIGLRP